MCLIKCSREDERSPSPDPGPRRVILRPVSQHPHAHSILVPSPRHSYHSYHSHHSHLSPHHSHRSHHSHHSGHRYPPLPHPDRNSFPRPAEYVEGPISLNSVQPPRIIHAAGPDLRPSPSQIRSRTPARSSGDRVSFVVVADGDLRRASSGRRGSRVMPEEVVVVSRRGSVVVSRRDSVVVRSRSRGEASAATRSAATGSVVVVDGGAGEAVAAEAGTDEATAGLQVSEVSGNSEGGDWRAGSLIYEGNPSASGRVGDLEGSRQRIVVEEEDGSRRQFYHVVDSNVT